MTSYEQGFMNKCAEYGVDGRVLLNKQATIRGATAAGLLANFAPGVVGGAAGAGIGALIDRKKRLRGALIGLLAGTGIGLAGGQYNMNRVADGLDKDTQDRLARLGHVLTFAGAPNQYDVDINPVKAALLMHGLLPKNTRGLYKVTPHAPETDSWGNTTYFSTPPSD